MASLTKAQRVAPHTQPILRTSRPSTTISTRTRTLTTSPNHLAEQPSWAASAARLGVSPGMGMSSSPGFSNNNMSYFSNSRPSLPANTIIKFVPQQTAWIVERMGKYDRILAPGVALLIPFIDRIAYVKSLKESALEIPSQSAITADNVTLDLDGVLYTRVFDAYKARYVAPTTVPASPPLQTSD